MLDLMTKAIALLAFLLGIIISELSLEPAGAVIESAPANIYAQKRPGSCVRIEVPLCKDVGYNYTYLPNFLNHGSQEEAGSELQHFRALIEINCSEDLRLLLCSFYAPICMPSWPKSVPPCKSVCVRARDGCIPFMEDYNYKWPEKLQCDGLPEDDACLRKNQTETNKIKKPKLSTNLNSKTRDLKSASAKIKENKMLPKQSFKNPKHSPSTCQCHCRKPLIFDQRDHFNKVITGNIPNCLMNCRSPYFSNIDETFPTFWLGLWAGLCLISTSVTIATFFVDRTRFQYPARPIIFLAICYFFVSIGYIIRLVLGHEAVACQQMTLPNVDKDVFSIRYGSSGAVACSIVFLLIYFFSSASAIWWVVLSATWFLAAGLKWSSEAITMYADVYHFFAWFIPGLQSILILTLSSVDGDPISGICLVGNTNTTNLLIFIIIPLVVFLLIGSGFLLAGFTALLKIRRAIKETGQTKTDKLEKLMIRIGIFGIIYSVPAICVIFCCIYEYIFRSKWETFHNCNCKLGKSNLPTKSNQKLSSSLLGYTEYKPEYSIFMLKYFMQLVIGTTSGFWIWTRKTLDCWRSWWSNCFSCLCCGDESCNRHKPLPPLPLGAQLSQQQRSHYLSPDSSLLKHSTLIGSSKKMPVASMKVIPPSKLSNNTSNNNNNNTNNNNSKSGYANKNNLPETLSTKALLTSNNNSSYNLNGRSHRSSSTVMIRSSITGGYSSNNNAPSTEIESINKMISLTHV